MARYQEVKVDELSFKSGWKFETFVADRSHRESPRLQHRLELRLPSLRTPLRISEARLHKSSLWICLAVLNFPVSLQAQDTKPQSPLLSTGVTGSIRATGLSNPQYVLSFMPVQRILLTAGEHPLSAEEIQTALKETPISLPDLLRVDLLRKDGKAYRLNYSLLTVQDQETIYSRASQFGPSLAAAFQARKKEFDSILEQYPDASLRPQLLFGLAAGVSLNWRGLDLTTELGYRIQPPRHPDGTIYYIHSAEVGAHTDLKGLYLDSEFAPAGKMMFATFGDGDSLPRLQGWPDVFDGLEHATDAWQQEPAVFGALQSVYASYAFLALSDAGDILGAVSQCFNCDATMVNKLSVSEDRRKAALNLLIATGYVSDDDHCYSVRVPLLTSKDKPMVDATLALSRTIMSMWLKENYALLKEQLSGLCLMRNGVPFSLAFSEVWHFTFGFATKELAESGFYANPRALGNRYQGYVPLVWTTTILTAPGG